MGIKVDIDNLQVEGKGKVKKVGPQPIYLNFQPDEETYKRLEPIRRKYGLRYVKALLVALVKDATF